MRTSITHPLTAFAPEGKPDPQEIAKIYSLLRLEPTEELKIRLFWLYFRYCVAICCEIKSKNSNSQSHDLVSEMIIALLEAIDKITDGAIDLHNRDSNGLPNIAGYFRLHVKGHLLNFVAKDRSVPIPHYMLFKKNKPIISNSFDKVPGKENKVKEILGTIINCTKNKIEKKFIQLRLEGYSDIEIAPQLNLSRSSLSLMRTRIEKRYMEVE